jgi:hypothetical protein
MICAARHAELVSTSYSFSLTIKTLKQVQGDVQ